MDTYMILNDHFRQGITKTIKAQLSDGKKWCIVLNSENGDVERNRRKIIQIA